MSGLSQAELDALFCGSDHDSAASPEECDLDTQLAQRKKKRGRQETEVAKGGLSQEELDALNCGADSDGKGSDADGDLDTKLVAKKKTNRRVTFSAVKSELTAISGTEEQQKGLAQASLDDMVVTEESYSGGQDLEDVDSMLRSSKRQRKRTSVGDGIVGAMARASELIGSPCKGKGGYTQEQLDRASELIGSPCKVKGGYTQEQLDAVGLASDAVDSFDNEEESGYALRTKRALAAARRGETEPMPEPPSKLSSEKQAPVSSPRRKGTKDVENAILGGGKELSKDSVFVDPCQPMLSPRRRSLQGFRSDPLSPVKLN